TPALTGSAAEVVDPACSVRSSDPAGMLALRASQTFRPRSACTIRCSATRTAGGTQALRVHTAKRRKRDPWQDASEIYETTPERRRDEYESHTVKWAGPSKSCDEHQTSRSCLHRRGSRQPQVEG